MTSMTVEMPLTLRSADGAVCAYFLPAAEVDRMRAEIEALKAEVAKVTRQREFYIAELTEVLKTYIPIPPTEEEMLAAVPNSDEIQAIITGLESR